MFKMINLKDKITKDFIKSVIYRKCLLWKDMNIVEQGFVHAEKKKITKNIEDNISTHSYAPTRPRFTHLNLGVVGQWSLNKAEGSSRHKQSKSHLSLSFYH